MAVNIKTSHNNKPAQSPVRVPRTAANTRTDHHDNQNHPPSSNKRIKTAKTLEHKTYRRVERRFRTVICAKIRNRRFDVQPHELYREAKVTRPTFYYHFNNMAHARSSYEEELEQGIVKILPTQTQKARVLEILMLYILKHRQYFLAAHSGYDHYLLTKIIKRYRLSLVGRNIGDQAFYSYSANLQAVIGRWLEFDKLTQETALVVAKKLRYVNVRP